MKSEFLKIIAQIEKPGIFPKKIPSLDPMRQALVRSGLLQHLVPARTVVVAGTNGKGSTCAYLERLLRSTGAQTLLYTSPHLTETTERIRLGGVPLTHGQFVSSFERIEFLRKELDLSHFETLTLMAADCFVHYLDPKTAWLILEVGLGGTWDSTNAFPHDYSVITRIGMDHQEFLGKTLTEIAENKLGIIPGSRNVTVLRDQYAEVERVFAKYRRKWNESQPPDQWTVVPATDYQTVRGLPPVTSIFFKGREVQLSMPGKRSSENAATALTIFEKLVGGKVAEHFSALSDTVWPGRMSFKNIEGIPVLFSGDHNLQGLESLCEILPSIESRHGIRVLFGASQDKPALEMLATLVGRTEVTSVYLTTPPFKGKNLSEYVTEQSSKVAGQNEDPEAAFKACLRDLKNSNEVLLVTGSLYLVGALVDYS